jgi:hypothetical protein
MTAIPSWPARAWALATEVPGRPAASRAARAGRAVPLLVPLLALVLLAGWKWGVQDTRLRAVRAANQPFLNLEREVAALESHRSPAGPEEAGRAAALRAALPRDRAGLVPALVPWRAQAATRGWEAAFGPPVDPPGEPGAPLASASVRGSFHPSTGNLHSWSTLLALLGDFSAPNSRIGVTRLAIRADEQGRYSVEMRLNLPYLAESQAYVK